MIPAPLSASECLALWKIGDFTMSSRWMVQPFEDGHRMRVAFGPNPDLPGSDFLWLWYPSGYQQPLGLIFPGMAPSLAQEIAAAIPGAVVMDGRPLTVAGDA